MALPFRRQASGRKATLPHLNRIFSNAKKIVFKTAGPANRRALLLLTAGVTLICLALFLHIRRHSHFDVHSAAHLAGSGTRVHFDRHVVPQARAAWQSASATAGDEGHWARVKDDVVFGVKTGHEVAARRLRSLRKSGWWSVGRPVPNIVAIGDEDDIERGVIGIKRYALDLLSARNSSDQAAGAARVPADPASGAAVPEHWFDKTGWKGDKDKNLPALHLMRHLFPGKKWYILLDDDTYIFLENLAHYVLQKGMDEKPVYTGKVFYISRCGGFGRDGTWTANHSEPKGAFAHGGSGIVLNSLALDAVYPKLSGCIRKYSSCWAGDMQVGLCMRDAGVHLHRFSRGKSGERNFIPVAPSKAMSDRRYTSRWRSANEPLTFHKIPPEELEVMSDYERKVAKTGKSVQYKGLMAYLLYNGIFPAPQSKKKPNKFYSTIFQPKAARPGHAHP